MMTRRPRRPEAAASEADRMDRSPEGIWRKVELLLQYSYSLMIMVML